MSGLGTASTAAAGAVAVILLILVLAEYEILRVVSSGVTRSRRHGLLIAIVPLLVVFMLIGILRLSDLAAVHP